MKMKAQCDLTASSRHLLYSIGCNRPQPHIMAIPAGNTCSNAVLHDCIKAMQPTLHSCFTIASGCSQSQLNDGHPLMQTLDGSHASKKLRIHQFDAGYFAAFGRSGGPGQDDYIETYCTGVAAVAFFLCLYSSYINVNSRKVKCMIAMMYMSHVISRAQKQANTSP